MNYKLYDIRAVMSFPDRVKCYLFYRDNVPPVVDRTYAYEYISALKLQKDFLRRDVAYIIFNSDLYQHSCLLKDLL